MSKLVDDAIDKYICLIELETETHSKTTRARAEIVRSLSYGHLAEFAQRLKRIGALSGRDFSLNGVSGSSNSSTSSTSSKNQMENRNDQPTIARHS